MPPKKKKPTLSSVVVGTVSTRSTRRQSIVNIDIPKLNRSSKNIRSPLSSTMKEKDELTAAESLSEKIKQTYNKMFSRILEMPTKSELVTSKICDSGSTNTKTNLASQVKSEVKSNEALLQILEDWTDDESQDDKKAHLDTENVKTENTQEFVKNDDNALSNLVHSRNVTSFPTNLDEVVHKTYEEGDRMETDESDSQSSSIFKTDNLEIESAEISEYIIEETEPVPIEEHVEEIIAFEEENIVECVTEEIITDENEQFILMDTSEGGTGTVVEINQQESTSAEVNKNDFTSTTSPHLKVMEEVAVCENKKITENLIVEETSHSLSTTDSNDAEVRGFFSREIENNKTVMEGDIPILEFSVEQANLKKENASSVNSGIEESETHVQTLTDIKDNAVALDEKTPDPSNENNECELDRIVAESEKLSLKESGDANKNEVVDGKCAATNKLDVVEPMETTEDAVEETIESKVAQMHLADEIVKEGDTINELSSEISIKTDLIDFKYPLKEEIEEVIGVKTIGSYSKEKIKTEDKYELSTQNENESVNVESPVEKPKTRRTRMAKEIEEELESKSAKTSRSKEKKPPKAKESKSKEPKPAKEPKNKKKPITPLPARRTKEKTDKKDGGKDKKESGKKSSRSDSDLSKKPSKIDISDFQDPEIRRSSRIKSISVLKKKTTGHGLVRSKSEPLLNDSDISDSNSTQTESGRSTPSASPKVSAKDKKYRWTRSNENLSCDSQSTTDSMVAKSDNQPEVTPMEIDEKPKLPLKDPVVTARLKQFVHLKENSYKTDRMTCKEAKKMTCDCFLTSDEIEANEFGCGEDCLNRLLLIECGNLCQVADRCTNKRFQKGQFAPLEVFNTEKKGLGLRAAANIPYGEFILEYVGEVLNSEEFDKRAEVYSQDKNIHYYFMSLRADAIIDATMKGNISRFINHSCDPNAETQKWTVNGELRIGFFSTRTILAGEEITFDYRFQRYGKEAQKCYCEASICRGWLGEQPDEDSEDEDEEEEEEEEEEAGDGVTTVKTEVPTPDLTETKKDEVETKVEEVLEESAAAEVKVEKTESEVVVVAPVTPKRKSPRKKQRKDLFEELDPLDEEIEMLVTTGLKNQAHTLKLSRLMVRAKEPPQRTKLLRILRRGELPCRRLFLDYHGLRLMHGYMIDAQHLVHADKKYESIRLEMLQTLAVLPIPNKTMLQDSKVLPTVEKWASNKDLGSPQDSDSNSPKNEQEASQPLPDETKDKIVEPKKEDEKLERSIEDQEEEIRFLASKLLEGWANLKEVFRIPKKERIEQMKEHEREANKKFKEGGYGNESESGRKSDRYRHLSRYKVDRESNRKGSKSEEKPSAEFIRLSKIERRKLFALQHELKEEERRLKQREMWRQHELNCMMIGTDPRFTAPFDPNRGYQYIWNPQMGQWQNYPLPSQSQMMYPSQTPTPNVNMPPPQLQTPKPMTNYAYQPMPMNGGIAQLPANMGMTGQVPTVQANNVPQLHLQQQVTALSTAMPQQLSSLQAIPGALPQIPTSISVQPPLPQYQEQVKKEEDLSQVKFMGPIPPPAKLPPKWKCAKDKYGRPFYYHIKVRKSQWEPPPFIKPIEEPEESSETESSSDTSSLSSDTSTENSDSDDDIDDTRLLIEVRKQMEKSAKLTLKTAIPDHVKSEETPTPSPDLKHSEDEAENEEEVVPTSFLDEEGERPSIDIRLKEQFNLLKDDNPPKKKRRVGLCEEIMISPRTEEDRLQFKEDLKRYKANKEKLKRQKEFILQQTRKQLREVEKKKPKVRATLKARIKEMPDFNSDQAKKIKESFRANMASTVVGSLNGYRKPDCKEGRITNTEDFKHLARKLTHFVMLKEMKHIEKIEDLTCTDNVKSKAREYIRKYMGKFGEVYVKRNDSPDFKD